ncbi:hypothetical protein A5724_13820 [Mycobacterium sp. ACS1612]|uniref:hypothetical protein n=1 Tax=Mycobacterium sp. ACS1612 TaxID=1834117 RepID=UPI0007FC2A6F|nr:hypothetical protein [Mycobacterium sp. ACS1612]OBF36265.1 hypothetical protein A5724_13820 [Mycobacterium sp. ACS1612]
MRTDTTLVLTLLVLAYAVVSGLFVGWFGPRGIGTLVLGLLMVERGEIERLATITQAVVVTVTVSLVVHSLTAPLGIRMWAASAVARES